MRPFIPWFLIAALVALLVGFAPPRIARACGPVVEVQFYEADGDIFVVHNLSKEPWTLINLEIVLTGSAGRLVFDTEDGGPARTCRGNSPRSATRWA